MTDASAIAELQVYMIALVELNDDAARVTMWLFSGNPMLGKASPLEFIDWGRSEELLKRIIGMLEGEF